jgi:Tfp pilus assembly protein FimT
MCHPRHRGRGENGFSLIEVLTVVTLFMAITGIAASNLAAMRPSYTARGAALAIAGDLNLARMSAIKEGLLHDFFPVGSGGYQIRRTEADGEITILKAVTLANEFGGVQFGRTGITVDPYGNAATPAMPTQRIIFHSNGTVQNAAGIYVQYPGHGQHVVSMTVAGRIRVWRYSGGEWA